MCMAYWKWLENSNREQFSPTAFFMFSHILHYYYYEKLLHLLDGRFTCIQRDNKHCDYVNNHSLGLHCARRANILIHRILDARVQEQRQIVQLCRHLCCNLLIELRWDVNSGDICTEHARWSFLQNINNKFSVWTKSFLLISFVCVRHKSRPMLLQHRGIIMWKLDTRSSSTQSGCISSKIPARSHLPTALKFD